ncbi:hypothetical protein D3C81_1806460 [compost metagenome]
MSIVNAILPTSSWRHPRIHVATSHQVPDQARHFVRIRLRVRRIANQQWLGQMLDTLQPLRLDQSQDQVKFAGARNAGIEATGLQRRCSTQQPVPRHDRGSAEQVVKVRPGAQRQLQIMSGAI